MKKIAVYLTAILLLVVFASGCTSNNNSTGNTSSNQNSSTMQNNSNTQNNSNVTVQINADSSWTGTLAYNGGTQVINGNGNATYNLGSNPGSISITLRKTSDNGTLSVQIIKNGNVVVNQSTSGSQGNINISYSS